MSDYPLVTLITLRLNSEKQLKNNLKYSKSDLKKK